MNRQDALDYHSSPRPGKIAVVPTKPLTNQRDLSLAYSPGVAEPCLEIERDPEAAYKYTARGNLVAVVTNGTAVLGLGNIGALAGKPVMEGKGNLFKAFADLDVFDLEVNSQDPADVIRFCQLLEPSVGAINLEDIKAPDCFVIEETLRKTMRIPVFHDDQHGTAIISGAALINALEVVGKKVDEVRVVFSGAGASALATAAHYERLGVRRENIVMCDKAGVIYEGRSADMDPYKARFASNTTARTVTEALVDADVFVGLSAAGVIRKEMIAGMARDPIVFALANPVPEILPEEVSSVRGDAIVATGRSDYPNQVNNVLGFPFIFRGALDARATEVNEEMKMAATKALAALAREPVPESVARRYGLKKVKFGRDYLIPFPFDPRVLLWVAPAVAWAAVASGVAKEFIDVDTYRDQLEARLGRARGIMRGIMNRAMSDPRRVVLAEGEDRRTIRAARILVDEGIAMPILLGNRNRIQQKAESEQVSLDDIEIEDPAAASPRREAFATHLWERRQRKGMSLVEASRRLYNPNYYGSVMVATGAADAMLSGATIDVSGGAAAGSRSDRCTPECGPGQRHVHARLREARRVLCRHHGQLPAELRAVGTDRLRGQPDRPCPGRGAPGGDALVLEFWLGAWRGIGTRGRSRGAPAAARPQPHGGRRDAGGYGRRRCHADGILPVQLLERASQRVDIPELECRQHRLQAAASPGWRDGDRPDPRGDGEASPRAGAGCRCSGHREHGGCGGNGRAKSRAAVG